MTKTSSLRAHEVQVANQRTHTTLGPLGRLKGLNSYASDVGLACLVYPDSMGHDATSQKSMGAVTRMALEQAPYSPKSHGPWRAKKSSPPNKMALERPRHCSSQGDGPSSLCLHNNRSFCSPRGIDQPAGDCDYLGSPASLSPTYSRLSMISSSGDDSMMTAYSRQMSSRTSWNSVEFDGGAGVLSEYSATSLAATATALQRFFHEPVVGFILALQYFSLVVVLCLIGFSEPGIFSR